jgi:alginate O-acetyltransferase complex protein AlgI
MENFNYPFISSGVAEFWRRWHISLGSWFRDYIYIPMGGNRVSKARWMFNILVVWMLTGLWHGAEWNFVFWGLYFALFLVLEKFSKPILDKLPKVLNHVIVLFLVLISFVLFNSPTLADFGRTVFSMFNFSNLTDTASLYYARSYAVTVLAACIGATPLLKNLVVKIGAHKTGAKVLSILTPVFVFVMVTVSTAYIVDGSFNPFLYFRF